MTARTCRPSQPIVPGQDAESYQQECTSSRTHYLSQKSRRPLSHAARVSVHGVTSLVHASLRRLEMNLARIVDPTHRPAACWKLDIYLDGTCVGFVHRLLLSVILQHPHGSSQVVQSNHACVDRIQSLSDQDETMKQLLTPLIIHEPCHLSVVCACVLPLRPFPLWSTQIEAKLASMHKRGPGCRTAYEDNQKPGLKPILWQKVFVAAESWGEKIVLNAKAQRTLKSNFCELWSNISTTPHFNLTRKTRDLSLPDCYRDR